MQNTMTRPHKPAGSDDQKKPVRQGRPLNVWLPDELMDALDQYVSDSRPETSAKAVTKAALEDFLASAGYFQPKKKHK